MITPAFALTATERVLPRLALDFTTGLLDPRVTVTRALNTATRINSSGLVEAVNADLPRFDYDPVTLASKGLLIEEARTNLTTYSNDFANPAWLRQAFGTASVPVLTPNFAASPDGAQNAARLEMTLNGGTTTADYAVQQHTSTTVVSGASYTYSIWLKSNTASNYIVLARDDGASTATTALWTVTPTWQRFSYTATTSATGSVGPKIWIRGGLGTSTSADLLIYGAQLEAGAFATSYIPTTTTSLTRNGDVVTMTGANFSSWYNASEGAFAIGYDTAKPTANSTSFYAFSVSDNTLNNLIGIRVSSANAQYLAIVSGSVPVIFSAAYTPNTSITACGAYKLDGYGYSMNKSNTSTDTSAGVPVVNRMFIGSLNGSSQIDGHIQYLRYYPQRITNREVQSFA